MRTILKILVYLFLVATALIALTAVGIKIFVSPDKAKAFLEKQLTSALHRQVQMGTVSIGLRGLAVSDFKLSERPDFSAGIFVSSDRFVVSPRLWPLLHKQIIIREILLVKPRITVVRNAGGATFNFSDLVAASPMPPVAAAVDIPASSPTASTSLQLMIGRIVIEQGQLDFVDRSTAAWSTRITGLNLRIEDVRPNAAAQIQSEFDAAVRGLDVKTAFTGSLEWPKILIVKNLTLETGGTKISAVGKAVSLNTVPSFDLTSHVQVDPALLKKFTEVPAELSIKGLLAGTLSANGTPQKFGFSLAFTLDPVALAYAPTFSKPAGVPLSLSASGTLHAADAVNADVAFQMQLNSLRLKGEGNVRSGTKALSYAFNMRSEPFSWSDIAPLVPMLKDYSPTGQASLIARFTSDPVPLSGKLTLAKSNFRYERSELTQLSGAVDFTTKIVSAPRLTGQLNGSGLTLSLKGRSLDVHPVVESHVTVQSLDLERLMPGPSPTPSGQKTERSLFVATAWAAPVPADKTASLPMDLKGTLKAAVVKHPFLQADDLAIAWNVTEVTSDLSKMSGSASLRQGRGQVKNIQKLVNESKAARVLLLPLTILQKLNKATGGTMKLPALDQVNFNQITGDYAFKAGLMTVTKFDLKGTEMDANLTGTAELAGDQKLTMKSTVKLAAGLVGGTVGDLLQDDEGRVTLPLTVKGTILDPKIAVDAVSTGKKIIDAIKNDPDKMKDVEELLKGIFK